ncbi:unnamed protein product [Malus baccata var. baccata]
MGKMNSNTQHSHDTVSWVRGKCIGRGSFGTVSIGVSKSDGRVFAVKSVDRAACLPGQLEALENEIRILRSLSSPHVVSYLRDDVSCESATSFRNLHLEYLPGGTAVDADVDETTLRSRVWCVVSALKHVHSKGIVHCDVKGRNVLVGPAINQAKLADFGSAIVLSDDTWTNRITPRGSPLWMAPEVINGEYQGPESDVWSLGCTIIEMATGKPAWEDRGMETLARIGLSGELPRFPTQLSETGRDFLGKCLSRDPKERWSCDQLLQHPFLASASLNAVADSSPRSVLDWVNSEFGDHTDDVDGEDEDEYEVSARSQISKLATEAGTNWESDGWTVVREYSGGTSSCEEEATSEEYSNCGGVELELDNLSGGGSVERGVNYSGWCAVGASGSKREYLAVERVGVRKRSRQSLCNLCRSKLLLLFFLYFIEIFMNKLRILFICYIVYVSLSWHGDMHVMIEQSLIVVKLIKLNESKA